MTSRLEQLERLVQLRDAGALTADEFEAEKARILAALEGAAVAPPTGHVGAKNARAGVADAATAGAPNSPSDANEESASDELSWNPFERPADVAVAERLSRFGLLAGGLLIADDLTLIGNLVLQSLTGATFDDGSTYASAFLPAFGILLIFLAVDTGLTFTSWRWRSRWSAIGLLALSALATGGSMLEILDGRTLWRVIQLVVSMAALFFAIQAVRGAFWLKAMGGLAGFDRRRAESESQMAQAFNTQMPAAARRRWLIMVGGAALVVIAVGIGSSLSENVSRGGEAPAQLAADATSPTMPGLVASSAPRPVESLPPLVAGQPFAEARQQLISAGYSPMPINLSGDCPANMCETYPEVMECQAFWPSPTADLHAPCTLRYRREADGEWIIVRTTGEYIPVFGQDVDFHDRGGAMFRLDEEGGMLVRASARSETGDKRGYGGMPVILEESVQQMLGASLALAASALDRIDATQRISHVAIAVSISNGDGLTWRTRAEHEASPSSMSIGFGSAERAPVQLFRARAALRLDVARLVEDLAVMLRRSWQR